MTKHQIMDSARHLPRSQQIDLALQLWEVLQISDADFPPTDPQKAELDRRIAESDANPQPPEEVDAIKSRLLQGEF